MSGPSYPSDPDAFSAMLSALAGGSGDAALFVGMLSRASEGTKLAPESKPWQLPVSGMDGPVGDELATSANEGTEAEGVDVSAMLGLPPRVSEEDDGELDGPLLPLDGHVVMTDVEVARRRSVWLWFSSLTPEERDKTLTVTDKHWCSFLLRLVDTVRRKGDGVFVIDVPEEGPVVDAPQGTSGRPRRSSYSGCVSPCAHVAVCMYPVLCCMYRKSSLIASLERSQPEVIFRSWKALGDSIPLSRCPAMHAPVPASSATLSICAHTQEICVEQKLSAGAGEYSIG